MGVYRDLDVYKCSFKAAIAIYRFTLTLPKYLQYDISDDLRRAARSVPSNIAEGYARGKSGADIKNFLKTALGSNDEVLFNYDFILALDLIDKEKYKKAVIEYKIIGVGIRKLIEFIKTNSVN